MSRPSHQHSRQHRHIISHSKFFPQLCSSNLQVLDYSRFDIVYSHCDHRIPQCWWEEDLLMIEKINSYFLMNKTKINYHELESYLIDCTGGQQRSTFWGPSYSFIWHTMIFTVWTSTSKWESAAIFSYCSFRILERVISGGLLNLVSSSDNKCFVYRSRDRSKKYWSDSKIYIAKFQMIFIFVGHMFLFANKAFNLNTGWFKFVDCTSGDLNWKKHALVFMNTTQLTLIISYSSKTVSQRLRFFIRTRT